MSWRRLRPPSSDKPHLLGQPGLIAATLLVMMTGYEAVKHLLIPDIATWGSRTITIIVTTLLTTVVSYFILHRLHDSDQDRLEAIWRRHATGSGRFIDLNPA